MEQGSEKSVGSPPGCGVGAIGERVFLSGPDAKEVSRQSVVLVGLVASAVDPGLPGGTDRFRFLRLVGGTAPGCALRTDDPMVASGASPIG